MAPELIEDMSYVQGSSPGERDDDAPITHCTLGLVPEKCGPYLSPRLSSTYATGFAPFSHLSETGRIDAVASDQSDLISWKAFGEARPSRR